MLIITDGNPRGLGYFEVDNRAAHNELPPGTIKHFEADTYTCSHCEAVVVLNPDRVRERYKCKGCNHHICDECAAKHATGTPCRTYAQFIDELRERDERQPSSSSIILP
jgi:hypothetical protein